MEQTLSGFRDWFRSNGGSLHQSIVLESDSNGIRPVVRDDASAVEPSATLVVCPSRLMVSYVHAQYSQSLKPLIERDPSSTSNQIITLRFFMIEQYLLAGKSFWWPYLQTLPQPSDKDLLNATPRWSDEEIRWLEKTNLAQATRLKKATWAHEYEQALACLIQHSSGLEHKLTWELYLWAATIMTSRSFPIASPTNHHEDIPALMPGLDALNHSSDAEVEWEFSSEHYAIKTKASLQPKCEVFNHYGPKGNAELMIGYGFCIENNGNDWFGLGFSHAVTELIRTTEAARSLQEPSNTDKITEANYSQSLKSPKSERKYGFDESSNQTTEVSATVNIKHDNEVQKSTKSHTDVSVDAIVSEQHSLCLLRTAGKSKGSTNDTYQFSPEFLSHSSIALENLRERKGYRKDWAKGAHSFRISSDQTLCRNMLHVLASTTMLLEKSLLELEGYRRDQLDAPHNHRQRMALVYRQEQAHILGVTLESLHEDIQRVLSQERPIKRLIRLEDVLQHGPKSLLQHFRALIHTALGTRKSQNIRNGGGEECTFTLWLYVIWYASQEGSLEDQPLDSNTLTTWMQFLQQTYGSPPLNDINQGDQDAGDADETLSSEEDEVQATATSYQYAIQLNAEKHEKTHEPSSNVSVPFLAWCLNVVRQESIRVPIPNDNLEEEEDELVLFIETPDDMSDRQ